MTAAGPAEVVAAGSQHGSASAERSVVAYFRAFAPAPSWHELVWWPPDVFALTNLVLDHTESYRFVVAPPDGERWPPMADWGGAVRLAARAWRDASGARGCQPPALVSRCWDTLTRDRHMPLAKVRTGEAWELTSALLTLHAIADEACADVTAPPSTQASFEARAWALLQADGSLSRLSATRVRVVPKTQLSARGITIRSLSRYVALCYESVDVRWRSVDPRPPVARRDYNMVLVPWPLEVHAHSFRPAATTLVDEMDVERFGFFEYEPGAAPGSAFVSSLLAAAAAAGRQVDVVIFPEAAVRPDVITGVEETLARHGASFLIAGVSEPPSPPRFGRNYLHFGVRATGGWSHYEQDKHHRWCLDERQIRQYHLTRRLHPKRLWWEAIEIRERMLHIVDVGAGVTTAPLVCEDLARLDEVADLVRRIGPSLVIAVLLDGPQLASRWPTRYASVVADDPGSAVLTLTSFGMATRSRPRGTRRSRVIAHWNDPTDGVREIELAPRASAVLVTASVESSTLWTADGRSHAHVPRLKLSGIHQLESARPAESAANYG